MIAGLGFAGAGVALPSANAWLHVGSDTRKPAEGGTWEYGFWNVKVRSYYTVNKCHGSSVKLNGDQDAIVRGNDALDHSYASGEYLITGSTTGLPAFKTWLTEHRVITKWSDNNLGGTLRLVMKQGSFVTSLLAATALMVSLVLYWLSVKARGRALRARSPGFRAGGSST